MSSVTGKEMAIRIAQVLEDKKGQRVSILDTEALTTLADYFVLCTGTSAPQLKAMSEATEEAMKELGVMPHHIEGHRGCTWVLQDYGDVIVHLFSEEARDFYNLDRLWGDAEVLSEELWTVRD